MNSVQKKASLEILIKDALVPICGKKCVLLGVPNYMNIGDVLIWEGTLDFLRSQNIKCTMQSSKETFTFPNLPIDSTILLQGGGNFGDLWLAEQRFRTKVIQHYPKHRIIILPQTIFYGDSSLMQKDAELYAQHPDLYICARDSDSYKILQNHFPCNHTLLVPDMAFCIGSSRLKHEAPAKPEMALFLKRNDKELKDFPFDKHIQASLPVETHDWPTYEGMRSFTLLCQGWFWQYHKRFPKTFDWFMTSFFRPHLVVTGVHFLNRYAEVYTTRLHVAILCTLLGKPYTFFDNSYGKNVSFYDTWLNDLNEATFIR